MTDLEKQFNYLNEIYYTLYESHLKDKITYFEWDNSKQNIFQLKSALKRSYEENTTSKQN